MKFFLPSKDKIKSIQVPENTINQECDIQDLKNWMFCLPETKPQLRKHYCYIPYINYRQVKYGHIKYLRKELYRQDYTKEYLKDIKNKQVKYQNDTESFSEDSIVEEIAKIQNFNQNQLALLNNSETNQESLKLYLKVIMQNDVDLKLEILSLKKQINTQNSLISQLEFEKFESGEKLNHLENSIKILEQKIRDLQEEKIQKPKPSEELISQLRSSQQKKQIRQIKYVKNENMVIQKKQAPKFPTTPQVILSESKKPKEYTFQHEFSNSEEEMVKEKKSNSEQIQKLNKNSHQEGYLERKDFFKNVQQENNSQSKNIENNKVKGSKPPQEIKDFEKLIREGDDKLFDHVFNVIDFEQFCEIQNGVNNGKLEHVSVEKKIGSKWVFQDKVIIVKQNLKSNESVDNVTFQILCQIAVILSMSGADNVEIRTSNERVAKQLRLDMKVVQPKNKILFEFFNRVKEKKRWVFVK